MLLFFGSHPSAMAEPSTLATPSDILKRGIHTVTTTFPKTPNHGGGTILAGDENHE
ncbi:MAG: hypothetical protein WCC45_08075 [Paeniglutamicibacter sp.]